MSCELPPDGEVNVYIEGLLVQTRDPIEVLKWSEDFGMRDIAEELNNSFYDKYDRDRGGTWAHHMKDVNGYVLIKAIRPRHYGMPEKEVPIIVSINESNPNAPTLRVTSNPSHSHFSVEYISALVALARYYAVDNEILGDTDGKEEEKP